MQTGQSCVVLSSNADSSGGGQYLRLPPVDFGRKSAGSGFSICSWFRFDIAGADRSFSRVFEFGNGAPLDNILLTKIGSSNRLRVFICCSYSCSVYVLPTPIAFDQWRHVCVVNQGNNWAYYDDGLIVGTQTLCTLSDVTLMSNFLGRSNWDGDSLLQGSISDFQIFDRSLSAMEVNALISEYASGKLSFISQ